MSKNLKTKVLLGLLFLLPSIWTGCTKQDDGSDVAPITVYEKINGTWNMFSLKLVDETAKSAGIKPDEMVITDQFNFQNFSITLNVDENKLPTTFSVSGDVPALLDTQGYWEIDKLYPATDGTPVVIYFYADEAKTQKTNQVSISSMPGATAEMELKLVHTSNQVAYLTYQYTLVAATQK